MEIRLEGSQQELSILFSDIRSFTTMTEALGTDIINLLNLHYKRAIGAIVKNDGVIGSLIGDAVLAVYGTFQESKKEKSIQAIRSAYQIQSNVAELRTHMLERRQKLIEMHGELTEAEERISNAVLLEVGVGIDGGTVFYGNIGSHERMTNTVIGDNVNSASRLEGITRIYNVPVICSEYVKSDIELNFQDHGIRFVELDMVQVKGKTEGKKIFWAIPDENVTSEMEKNLAVFSQGLDLYFKGNWASAYGRFAQCTLPMARVFTMRTKDTTCPNGWNGIWEMKAK
jgi:adenylate cyclase